MARNGSWANLDFELVWNSNDDTLVRNFYARIKGVDNVVRPVVGKYGELVYQMTYDRTPKETWFMADNLRLDFTEYNFVVGWYQADFESAGRRWYPPYVIYGTYKMAARPSLPMAYSYYRPRMKMELSKVLKRHMKKRRK